MTIRSITHVALRVRALPDAERLYGQLFGIRVAYREAEAPDGWRTLPEGLAWDEAVRRGISPGMSVLSRDGFRLALEAAQDLSPGLLDHVGLLVDETELQAVRSRVEGAGCTMVTDTPSSIVVEDPLGVRWELTTSVERDPLDQSHGRTRGLWLELPD